ncbi:MAG: PAS domain S-box protein [Planctomycetes bacterium]|jgi:PAS domain S-box-containing protein|nr:PAS domain S-box protein [Planctomycetota bacterium]
MTTDPNRESAPTPADSRMLGAIFDTTDSVILGLTPDHRIFAWNRAAEDLYQTPRATAIGMDYVVSFIAPEHRDAVAADIRAVLAGKRTLDFEDDSILPDGTRRTLIWNVVRVLGADGAPSGIVATGQDITSRKEMEERFRLVFEHSQDGLLLADDSGIIDCNPAALRMLGLTSRDEMIGRRAVEFSPQLQPDGSLSAVKSRGLGAITLARGAHTFDWMHLRQDGSEIPVEVSVRHATLQGRRVSVVSWRDQTRRREVEQRLNLAHKMQAVGQLAAGVAHDFNNLLAAIRNSVQLARNEVPPSFAIHEDLDLALRATDRAAQLTGRLLAFERPQRRATAEVDLAALVREMLPLLRSSLPASVTVRLDADVTGVFVRADRSQLDQVVLNLVLNARDAMPDGGTLSITVERDLTLAEAALTVEDTGIGMDEPTRQRIFEPFFTTKPIGSGTGLGLAVVYGVVTQAGGTISVDSAPSRGTRMRITLPCSDGAFTNTLPEPATHTTVRHTILLVDDDAAVRQTTKRLLERQGFTVLEAGNGIEALKLFDDHQARLSAMLTDLRMPDMDGVRLAQAVRILDAGFPIAFFSGFDELGPGVSGDLARVPLLQKPFAVDALLKVLTNVIESRPRAH